MNMSSYKKIVITNRHICTTSLTEQLEKILPDIDIVILREKDMTPEDYYLLASDVIKLCGLHNKQCILHTFTDAARRLKHMQIHLPLNVLREQAGELTDFDTIGASVHSIEEACEAVRYSASYLIASHIFSTDCKPDLEPKGPELLRNIKTITDIPIYALGGINDSNEHIVYQYGADGACRMSDYMQR